MMDSGPRLPLESDVKRVLTLDFKEIPTLSPVLARLLEIFSNENASMEALSQVVHTDPGLSARVLGLVNSAMYGLTHPVTNLSEAVVYLGVDGVKRLALGITVFEKIVKSGRQKQFDRLFFWRHCLSVATLAMAIAEQTQSVNPGEAYACGLLHDFGKIFFDLQGCVNYGDFIATLAKSTNPMITDERELMGMGHDDLGAYCASQWNLPRTLLLTIKYHHQRYAHLDLSREESQLIAIVSLANFLSWTQGMGSVDIVRPPLLQPEVEENIDLDGIDVIKVIGRMDREMRNISKFYNFVFPSPSQLRANLLLANLKLCSINTRYYYQDHGHSNTAENTVDMSQIRQSLTAPHKSLDPREIIKGTLEAIYKDFKFNRLYVMCVVKRTRCLKVVESLDTSGTKMNLRSIEIPLHRGAGGFIHCLRSQEPVIIRGRTMDERRTLEQFKIDEMVIVPFYSHNRVLGILGMDNIVSKKPILPDVFSAIAIVANELGMAMENAGAYKDAKKASLRDGLTGLLNRIAIDGLLEKAFRGAVEGKNDLSLVMIDVDFFKKFNDNFGHQSGDSILKLIANTLKKLSRPFDHVGRYGGEEFIVVLTNTGLSQAIVYAERIRREIEHLGVLLVNRFPGLALTVSAGVSGYEKNVKNREVLIAKADKALYQAKETGRNKVVVG
ncbi:signal transduction family protein (GGDEF domain protein) [Desulforapulum autotrophicum HRM2]|uniref:diguanylate cyclase n=1 Tax=Desulforapulum autotrophicum (strain ATCC 43914 / DSM 3382 / VKM B-1955 / HRM2) TaxID=177437 RepID=C0QEP1_DESAH|nr:HDOD domain-containing protein [Desulforapulum autotrophicum]ACN15383.1 signal transduction family protein (GGDEF domain protein) [Desulforapulum autotrophicum HRM2]